MPGCQSVALIPQKGAYVSSMMCDWWMGWQAVLLLLCAEQEAIIPVSGFLRIHQAILKKTCMKENRNLILYYYYFIQTKTHWPIRSQHIQQWQQCSTTTGVMSGWMIDWWMFLWRSVWKLGQVLVESFKLEVCWFWLALALLLVLLLRRWGCTSQMTQTKDEPPCALTNGGVEFLEDWLPVKVLQIALLLLTWRVVCLWTKGYNEKRSAFTSQNKKNCRNVLTRRRLTSKQHRASTPPLHPALG